MEYITAKLSEVGGRSENQDYLGFIEKPPFSCWVVADGLGGHRGGAAASRIAVETILDSFAKNPDMSEKALRDYIESAQELIIKGQEEEPQLYSMRTTIVILITGRDGAIWGYVGDSRLYHFSSGRIIFQTKDHSVPQAMADAGDIRHEDIRHHEDRNRLLRTLGHEGSLRPALESNTHIVQDGDAFLLCTDGFWEYVTEIEMMADLAKANNPNQWLDCMASRITQRAEGNYDNYSAIAVFAEDLFE
ncbi:MAG: PP2C family serine/threonine-protein phosphatase [Desulfamplus sp.]